MDAWARVYPYDKPMVLNMLYDALDALAMTIDSANSVRGVLLVSSGSVPRRGGRIGVSPNLTGDRTRVEVFPSEGLVCQREWVDALFDEMESVIRGIKRDGGTFA